MMKGELIARGIDLPVERVTVPPARLGLNQQVQWTEVVHGGRPGGGTVKLPQQKPQPTIAGRWTNLTDPRGFSPVAPARRIVGNVKLPTRTDAVLAMRSVISSSRSRPS